MGRGRAGLGSGAIFLGFEFAPDRFGHVGVGEAVQETVNHLAVLRIKVVERLTNHFGSIGRNETFEFLKNFRNRHADN